MTYNLDNSHEVFPPGDDDAEEVESNCPFTLICGTVPRAGTEMARNHPYSPEDFSAELKSQLKGLASREAILKALAHFKEGATRMESYVATVTEAMNNIELCSTALTQQSDEFVVRRAITEWGLPCNSLQYSNSVRLGLPRQFQKIMLEELQPANESWCQGVTDKYVTGLIGVLKAHQSCTPSALSDDAYYSRKDGAVRFSSLLPLGGIAFLGKNSTLPVNGLFDLSELSPMLIPSVYFTQKDIMTLGGVAQSISRCHHGLAYANYNVKVLAANATVVRSGSSPLPDCIEEADDYAVALTQAMQDAHNRTGNFTEAGIALGGLFFDIEAKMKKYQKALKDLYLVNCQIGQLLDRSGEYLDKVHTARVREEGMARDLFKHFTTVCGIDQMMAQLETTAASFLEGLYPNSGLQITGRPKITFDLSGCRYVGATTYSRESSGVSRNVFSKAVSDIKELKISRPRVNRVRPTNMRGSVVTGPCWSVVQTLFQDSDYLTNFEMNPSKKRRRSQGTDSALKKKQMDFKKNLSRRAKSNGVGLLAGNVIKPKRTEEAASGSKVAPRVRPSSTPIRTSMIPSSSSSMNTTDSSVKTKSKVGTKGTTPKLTKAERQQRLRKALILDSTTSLDSDEEISTENGVVHGPKGADSDKESPRVNVDPNEFSAQDESALLEEREASGLNGDPTGPPISPTVPDDAAEMELLANPNNVPIPPNQDDSETEMEIEQLF